MKEASYYKKLKNGLVTCELCPHNCVIKSGECGKCSVRKNTDGKLFSLFYGKPCTVHIDPIEKKPLFHFFPGEKTLSIATVGCNLSCSCCQNWEISKEWNTEAEEAQGNSVKQLKPEEVVELCKKRECKIISYTYTEPTIFFEYMIDIAKLAKKEGIKNVIVSNGFINEKPLKELCKYLDGANIDLKGFNEEFYKDNCGAKLAPVLNTLKALKKAGIWLEITNLVIPGLNDDPELIEKMCSWIEKELGKDTPLHFSRFHPDYKVKDIPPTPPYVLKKAEAIGKKHLNYIYIGNLERDSDTICPGCKKSVIKRTGFSLIENKLNINKCVCKTKIDGVWE